MINKNHYFQGISPEIWTFCIGGYQPAQKWLKDRKGLTLSEDDIQHYRGLCAILSRTSYLMTEIDNAIATHGGWPITS